MSLLPLGLIGAFSLRIAQEIIATQVANQLDNLAQDKVNLLERWLAERDADIQVVAEAVSRAGPDPAFVEHYLESVRTHYRVYEQLVAADLDGRPVAGSHLGEPIYRGEAWFREALAGKTYRSPMMRAADRQGSVFWISTPIRRTDGEVAGAIGAAVDTDSILSDILQLSLGRTGESYLVSLDGTFLAHKEPHRIFSENISQSGSFQRIVSATRARRSYLDYRDVSVLGAWRPVAGTDWVLVVEQDEEEAFAGRTRLRRAVLGATAAAFFASVLIAWGFALSIVGPIKRLRLAAGALERGDFQSSRIRGDRRDEIGDLYRAFLKMAGELKSRQTSLERTVDQKETKLLETSRRLERTEAMAVRAEKLAALGQLAAGVAHEVRNPLASLKLYLQSLESEADLSDEGREDHRVALSQVHRMEATISRFLGFARPQEPVPALLDAGALLEESLLIVAPRAHKQGIRIRKEMGPDLPPILGDRQQLAEALVNLMINALEAMGKGGLLTVSIAKASRPERAAPVPGPGPWIRIVVEDTGEGMPPEVVEKLFDPFFTTKPTGTGLGLPIVHQTVTGHGGEVRVVSRPGEGTRFVLLLPAADEG